MSAFFVPVIFVFFTSILFGVNAYANDCRLDAAKPETASVKWVYDGDTLLLNDGRKIRLIGIDAPETGHKTGDKVQKGEAYSGQATEALRELIKYQHNRVVLQYGPEPKDRYGRTLAHVYLPDGSNISAWMLENGFARSLLIPPNIRLAECYQMAEARAQQQSLRIWRLKRNRVLTLGELLKKRGGVVRVEGILQGRLVSWMLKIKDNSGRFINLRIKKANRQYFQRSEISKLLNKPVRVSGFLRQYRGRKMLEINHPLQLKAL